jgi:hypothetical protein
VDKKELVSAEIDGGANLVQALEREGLPIAAAMWLRSAEQKAWQLYIASPDVEKHGPIAVYKMIDKVLARMPDVKITVDDVVAANTRNHFVNAVASGLSPTNQISHVTNAVFSGVPVDEAFIYKVRRKVRPSAQAPKVTPAGIAKRPNVVVHNRRGEVRGGHHNRPHGRKPPTVRG